MYLTRALLQRQPLIRFIGKHTPPATIDHTPQAHPASPAKNLPDSFASYRQNAQQHGPLGTPRRSSSSASSLGAIGSQPGGALGPVEPAKGQLFDRSELPARFRRMAWSQAEIDAVESGGASLFA